MKSDTQATTTFRALMDAFTAGDVDGAIGLLAPDFIVWHNTGGIDEPSSRVRSALKFLHKSCTDVKYTIERLLPTDDGLVGMVRLTAVNASGAAVNMPCCMVVNVNDEGLITRVDEYLDGSHANFV
jgi:ketosteroid isomerase-like protein